MFTNKTTRHDISEWLLFTANSAIVQWDDDEARFVLVLVHWNNSPRVDMSHHSDTLFWFRANQSLLFLLNNVCLAEKQQISIL